MRKALSWSNLRTRFIPATTNKRGMETWMPTAYTTILSPWVELLSGASVQQCRSVWGHHSRFRCAGCHVAYVYLRAGFMNIHDPPRMQCHRISVKGHSGRHDLDINGVVFASWVKSMKFLSCTEPYGWDFNHKRSFQVIIVHSTPQVSSYHNIQRKNTVICFEFDPIKRFLESIHNWQRSVTLFVDLS